MKLASQLLSEYIDRYPIYNRALFSIDRKAPGESLPSLFTLTQRIIDTFISNDSKRIAIILPDNDCNVIPLILTKYFCNVQHEAEYAGNIFDDIQPGQRLRLGDAVVEFVCIDKKNETISFKVGKEAKIENPQPVTITSKISSIHYLFEKCEGAISSQKAWAIARQRASENQDSTNILDGIKVKRTALNKTMLLLSLKNDFKDYVEALYINGAEFQDMVSYGEIDVGTERGFRLSNRGKLDCLPALAVSARLDEIYTLLKTPQKEKIFAVFSTPEKFNELVSNIDTLKKCLKQDVPFVVFVPESAFEDYPLLSELGFEMWHWKPSMMRSEVFLQENSSVKNQPLFGRLWAKATQAALAEFNIKRCNSGDLKTTLQSIRQLSDYAKDWDSSMRTILHKIWSLQFKLSSLLCPLSAAISSLSQELNDIKKLWYINKSYYSGQDAARIIDFVLNSFEQNIAFNGLPGKGKLLSDSISETESEQNITVLVSDKYEYLAATKNSLFPLVKQDRILRILKLSEFYAEQENGFRRIDRLIVTWFDKDEYIKIKQTYCYDKLTFLLYDFENKWREGFISRFDVCLSHEIMKKNAARIGLSQRDFLDTPSDAPINSATEQDSDYKEIEDFNITKNIVRSIVRGGGVDANASDSVEIVPVLLSGDFIGYFYPTREIIEVSGLISGDSNRPLKKEACKLRKGDRILVRQSGRDIIREKADELMLAENKTDLRDISAIWCDALRVYAEDKPISILCRNLRHNGGDCTEQQVRYWLAGETICPSDKAIITAILKLAREKISIEDIGSAAEHIFSAGREVRSYHQRAGFWLNSALKNKAREIKDIIRGGVAVSRGVIDGIGEIYIYTVEDILDKDFVSRSKLNKVEALF